jgi:hypothetical protein
MRFPFLVMERRSRLQAQRLAFELGVPRQLARGLLLELWEATLDIEEGAPIRTHARDAREVAAWVEWQGDPERLAAALEVAGFLEPSPEGLRVRGTSRYLKLSEMQRQRGMKGGRPRKEPAGNPPGFPREPAGNPSPSPSPSPSLLLAGEDSATAETSASGGSCAAGAPSHERGGGQRAPELKLEPGTQSEKPSAELLASLWNAEAAPDLPRWRGMSSARQKAAQARLSELPLEGWLEVIRRINASDFCRGDNDRGWRASPDWLLRPDTANKVMEGKYERAKRGNGKAPVRAEAGKHEFVGRIENF